MNLIKVTASYLLSRMIRKPYINGMPISISLEPTTSCNLGCPECPSGLRSFTRPTGRLDNALFRKVIDEVSVATSYLTFYFQGEPYLNPDFLPMVSYASGKGLYTSTSTNAHFLDEATAKKTVLSGLDRLIISIDGTDQDTYASYRKGGSLNKVLEGTRKILKWRALLRRSRPAVVWQFLVVGPNEHQIPELRALAREYGVDKLALKTAQIYDHKHGNSLIPSNEKYSRYEKQSDGTYRIKNRLLDHCWKMWSSCVITWDGRVVPCCFDKDAQYEMGDVSRTSFQDVWLGLSYHNFRKSLIRSRSEIEICRNCSEGSTVWA